MIDSFIHSFIIIPSLTHLKEHSESLANGCVFGCEAGRLLHVTNIRLVLHFLEDFTAENRKKREACQMVKLRLKVPKESACGLVNGETHDGVALFGWRRKKVKCVKC